ncbi:hypothetical protein [Streptomyces spectabilis]|uniref:Uncharacterized protein n=1 Tax=Streptomyces spectabilis TaxID=68270 RepID=A0A7W8B3R1_STRST|nr:hypothetical protein [Streptomyces spectabilis]MBB5109786.1 hypothetical protein [Streptomyces spectabilis]
MERGDMSFGPRVLVQSQDRANEHVLPGGQHHHEHPHPAPLTGARINPLAQEAAVDLGLRAWLNVVPQDGDLRGIHSSGSVACTQWREDDSEACSLCSSRSR